MGFGGRKKDLFPSRSVAEWVVKQKVYS